MPNRCTSTYICKGDSLEISLFNNLLTELENLPKSLVDNVFGKSWLGNLVIALGGDLEKISCRGSWTYRDLDKTTGLLTLELETAWGEFPEIRDLIKSSYPSIEIIYLSEEPGMGIYITNDKNGLYFPDRFRVEIIIQDQEFFNKFETKSEAVEYINEITNLGVIENDNLDEALPDWEDSRDDIEYARYIEFEIVDD